MILSICLIVLAAFAKALMGLSADGKLIDQLNKQNTWRLKWKDGDPANGERFFGSSTVFVFLTDTWHLFQAIFLAAIFALVVSYEIQHSWWLDFICIRILFGVSFELFYRWCVR
jgi:maltooligosyltrehalose synthase